MTPKEIATTWLAKDGEIRPVPNPEYLEEWPIPEYQHLLDEWQQQHTYPCPTLKDGEYRGDGLEFLTLERLYSIDDWKEAFKDFDGSYITDRHNREYKVAIRLKTPAIDAREPKQSVPVEVYHVCHSCQLIGMRNCSEFDKCGNDKTYPLELRQNTERWYKSGFPLSLIVEKSFDMGHAIKSNNLVSVEEVVEILENEKATLTKAHDTCPLSKSKHTYRHSIKVVTYLITQIKNLNQKA